MRRKREGRGRVVLGRIADGVGRTLGAVTDLATAPFTDTTIRLGVTGLSRAGKTVFITSLVANLMDRGRMPQLLAAANGAIRTAYLQPQPDDTVPRFPFEDHMARLLAPEPSWPEGTRSVSELRLSLRVQPTGLLSGLSGPRTVHLDIIDYPGEWLLDLGLMDKSFARWSEAVLARARTRAQAAEFLALLDATDPAKPLDEGAARGLAEAFTGYLRAAREAGYADLTPGRFLLPGDLAGSPVLTFAPLPPGHFPRRSLGRELARRYDSYRRNVVTPFFRDHFARLDRQIVLVDVLGAIAAGPRAVEDLRLAMADILSAFSPGRMPFLARLLGARRIDRVLIAATKADHLHHSQHPALTALAEALLREARDRADFAGARTAAMSIAALRATVEDEVTRDGRTVGVVRGRLEGSDRAVAFHPGELPADPGRILSTARAGGADWAGAGFRDARLAPPVLRLEPGEGPPHIRLDKAAQFLIGDRL